MSRRRYSQAALAQKLEWKQQALSRRLCGHTSFNVVELEAIAGALDVTIAELIDRSVSA